MALLWRIYYADGTTFDSYEGAPDESPDKGVICVVQPDKAPGSYNVGRDTQNEKDWFLCYDNQWLAVSTPGMKMHIKSNRLFNLQAAREGMMLPFVEYRKIMDKALADMDFPRPAGKRAAKETDE